MTIATMLPDILAECGIDDDSPDILSDDFTMVQLRTLIDAAGQDINKRVQWSLAIKPETVAGGTSTAALPDDFQEMVKGGAVRLESNPSIQVRPVRDIAVWNWLDQNPGLITYYSLNQGALHFTPVLDAQGASYLYVSKNWLGTTDHIEDGTETPIFPESLLARGTIWRWMRQKGLPYEDHMAEFEADLEEAIKADRGA